MAALFFDVSVQLKNPTHFGDRFRVARCAVIGGHDQLRGFTAKMRAPVWNNTVTAIWRIAAPAVTFNCVEGNSGRGRVFLDFQNETALGRKCVDAGGNPI